MNTVLEIKEIRKSFAMNHGRARVFGAEYKNVINDLSISLEEGMVTSLVGGNGEGKTTLFNLISGLLRPDNGQILYVGERESIDCILSSPWQIARAGIGRMFQGARVFDELSVKDHLLIQARQSEGEKPFSRMLRPARSKKLENELSERIYHELKGFEEFRALWDAADTPAAALSFARQRLLSLAGLLVGGYDLLLLDEPSSGLSRESFETLYKLLDVMRERGKTVFLIEHNMEFIKKAADTCHYMAEGRIHFSGSPEEVLDHADVKQSYLL